MEFQLRIDQGSRRRQQESKQTSVTENKRAMLESIDLFHLEKQRKSKAIREVATIFEIVQIKSLLSATEVKLLLSIGVKDELSERELLLEKTRLKRDLKTADINFEKAKDWSVFGILKYIAYYLTTFCS